MENRNNRAPFFCFVFSRGGGGGTPVDGEYKPEKYGVPQIDNADLL